MSVERKLCLWSAVNIDGQTSKPDPRPTKWLIDPRIPREAQTLPNDDDPKLDVYGNAPRFARGHMTRREDPIWGDPATSHQGQPRLDALHERRAPDADVQRQDLERSWRTTRCWQRPQGTGMRISVITGPVFGDEDRVMFGRRSRSSSGS